MSKDNALPFMIQQRTYIIALFQAISNPKLYKKYTKMQRRFAGRQRHDQLCCNDPSLRRVVRF